MKKADKIAKQTMSHSDDWEGKSAVMKNAQGTHALPEILLADVYTPGILDVCVSVGCSMNTIHNSNNKKTGAIQWETGWLELE